MCERCQLEAIAVDEVKMVVMQSKVVMVNMDKNRAL